MVTSTPRKILRRPAVEALTGKSRSTLYRDIAAGLLTKPVALGAHSVGWPAEEIDAINAARIAGKSDADIIALVQALELARKAAA